MKPMDNAQAGLLSQLIEEDQGFDTLRAVERDAYEQGRAEGRREGLLEAAKCVDGKDEEFVGDSKRDAFTPWVGLERGLGCRIAAAAIRKLIEAEKGGGA